MKKNRRRKVVNRRKPARRNIDWRKALLGLAAPLVIAAALLGPALYALPLSFGGEATLADMARETGANGALSVPRLDGVTQENQALLPVWLSRLQVNLLGARQWAPRLAPALFSLGALVLVWAFGLAIWGEREAALASLIMATSLGFLAVGRSLCPEPLAGLFVCLALWGGYRLGQDADWGGYLFWLGSAGALLCLGPAGLLLTLGPVLLFGMISGHWALFLRLFRWKGLVLFLVLAGAPLVWACLQDESFAAAFFLALRRSGGLERPGLLGQRPLAAAPGRAGRLFTLGVAFAFRLVPFCGRGRLAERPGRAMAMGF